MTGTEHVPAVQFVRELANQDVELYKCDYRVPLELIANGMVGTFPHDGVSLSL